MAAMYAGPLIELEAKAAKEMMLANQSKIIIGYANPLEIIIGY